MATRAPDSNLLKNRPLSIIALDTSALEDCIYMNKYGTGTFPSDFSVVLTPRDFQFVLLTPRGFNLWFRLPVIQSVVLTPRCVNLWF